MRFQRDLRNFIKKTLKRKSKMGRATRILNLTKKNHNPISTPNSLRKKRPAKRKKGRKRRMIETKFSSSFSTQTIVRSLKDS